MRITKISAGVLCALFGLGYYSSAQASTTLSIEERLALLESRLNQAEQEASQAKLRADKAEKRTIAAEQQLAQVTKKQEKQTQQIETVEKNKRDDGFEFSAYARSGLLINEHGKGGRGGPGEDRRRETRQRVDQRRVDEGDVAGVGERDRVVDPVTHAAGGS